MIDEQVLCNGGPWENTVETWLLSGLEVGGVVMVNGTKDERKGLAERRKYSYNQKNHCIQ